MSHSQAINFINSIKQYNFKLNIKLTFNRKFGTSNVISDF